jgi:hypothetical protein
MTYTEEGRGSEMGCPRRPQRTEDREKRGADKMHGEGPFYSCAGGGWMRRTGQLGRARSAARARAGADGAASSCYDSLAWRQRTHDVVL